MSDMPFVLDLGIMDVALDLGVRLSIGWSWGSPKTRLDIGSERKEKWACAAAASLLGEPCGS